MSFKTVTFSKARPVWLRDGAREMNRTVLLETTVPCGEDTELHMAGHFSYQVFINGNFVFFGPARAGRGYYRVDKLPVGKYLTEKENRVVVLVNGYHCDSYYFVNEQAFFCAEFVSDGEVFGETGGDAWNTYIYDRKIQKVQRYSFQRPFVEVYDLTGGGPLCTCGLKAAETVVYPISNFIEREVSLPEFPEEAMLRFVDGGSAIYDPDKECQIRKALLETGVKYTGYRLDELDIVSEHEAEKVDLSYDKKLPEGKTAELCDSFVTVEMKTNISGFIKFEVECKSDATLIATFDEILLDGKVDFQRMGCKNVVIYRLKAGERYTLLTAEPYTFKFMNVMAIGGAVELKYMGVVRLDFNASEIIRRPSAKADEQIERIYHAAVQSFRQNTLDIYMDCPSRERAGWLCDSFFTSRVEKLLTGKSVVEHSFLENFNMEDSYDYLPEGMIPMCYPSDHPNGNFIPNWAMWYGLEVKEYFERTGDREFIDSIKQKLYGILGYFRNFENQSGLLEKLEKWVFVEWSMCNKLVQDINYPTNMLYAMFKRVLCELYGDEGLGREAEQMKKAIREQSRLGLFFCDNAVYGEDGVARLSGERTEACQYYAFFTGIATPEEDGELWDTMIKDFGPERRTTGKWPEIHPSNLIVGDYMRCELLKWAGLDEKLDSDVRGYFDEMALKTGTLWEHNNTHASCNHGFASHALVWLDHLGYID